MAEKQVKQLTKKGLSKSVKTFIIVAIVTVVLAVGGFTTYTLVANKQNEQSNVVFQQTYNISYILDGGENSRYNSETYKPGDEITLQPASKEGSLFLGWYTDANFENQIKKITRNDRQDFTLYAKWGVLDLEINYELDGGYNDIDNPYMFHYGDEDILLKDASKYGYTFKGWYLDANFENALTEFNTHVANNVTLYAKFEITNYSAIYKADGVVVDTLHFTVENMNAQVAPLIPAKVGYTAEWDRNITLDNLVIEAIYTPIEYTITYNTDGAENSQDNPSTYTIEDASIPLVNLTKTGYTFGGWYTESEFTNRIYTIDTTSAQNYTLYAKWDIITYYATFVANGDVVANIPFTIEDMTVTAPAVPTRIGYTGEWQEYEATLQNFAVTAEYTIVTYTITYNLNGGINSQSNPTSFTVNDQDITLEDASLTGYEFIGWYTDNQYAEQITVIDTATAHDYVLYAKFNTTDYTATFMADDNVVDTVVFNVINMSEFTAPSVPDKLGYTGVWENYTVILDNFTVNAVYSIVTYTITYKLVDGINSPNNPSSYTVNDANITLQDPTKDGFTFKGWYLESNYQTQISVINTQTVQNYKIYAKWSEIVYTVTFMNKGAVHATKTFKASNPTITNPSVPKQTGYTVTWEEYTIDPEDLHDFTVNAVYTLVSYVIYYKMYNGTNNPNNPTSYTVEDANITLLDPTKAGNTFMGWYTEPEFENVITIVDTSAAKRYNIYAKWEEKYLTIRYLNGEDVLYTEAETLLYGSSYTIRDLGYIGDEQILTYKLGTKEYMPGAEITVNTEPMDIYVNKKTTDPTGYEYQITSGVAIITNYTGSDVNLKVPSYVLNSENGKYCAVARVDYCGWDIISVVIPETVKNINECAFMDCTYLERVEILGSTKIWRDAFEDCKSLTTVIMPYVTYIGAYSFCGCTAIESITIPDTVTTIDVGAFCDCTSLRNVVIEGFPTLGGICFGNCISIESLELPSNIEQGALDACYNLKTVAFKENSTHIDLAWFDQTGLEKLIIPESVTQVDMTILTENGGDWYDESNTEVILYPSHLVEILNYSDVNVEQKLEWLREFYGIMLNPITVVSKQDIQNYTSSYVTVDGVYYYVNGNNEYIAMYSTGASGTVTLHTNCIAISSHPHLYAAYTGGDYQDISGNHSVRKDDWPDVVTYDAFKNVQHIIIPANVQIIGCFAFANSALQSITFLDNSQLEGIGCYAFYKCINLTNISLPNSITELGNSAFYNCSSLTSINLPMDLSYIGDDAFSYCSSLMFINLPQGCPNIVGSAFWRCDQLYTIINFSDYDIDIGSSDYGYIAYYAKNIIEAAEDGELIEENGVRYYKDSTQVIAYYCNPSAIDVTLRSDCTEITGYAFYNCASLKFITLPATLTSIGEKAFSGCSVLYTIINYSELILTIGDENSNGGIACYAKNIIEAESDCELIEENDISYYKDSTKVIAYACNNSSITTVLLRSDCTEIGNYVFYDCSSLTSISLPASVTSIGDYAFYYCNNLLNVYYKGIVSDWCSISFGSNIANPMYYASHFYILDTSGDVEYNGNRYALLTELVVPEGVTQISQFAFDGFNCLTSITLPSGVTSIGNSAFRGCSALASISLPNSVTSIGDSTFYNCTELTSISLPNGVTSISQYAFYSCSNLASVYLPSSLTSIGDYAFYSCSALTSISLPASVTTIGNCSFDYCISLASVTFESNSQLTSIGQNAFYSCSNLASVVLPSSLTSIGQNAFYSCSNLASVYLPSSLTSIDSYAFRYCNKLYTIINGSGLTLSMGSTNYGYVAYYAKNIITTENGYQLIEENDISYYKDSTKVIAYACNNSSITTVTLRSDCTEIANYVFYNYSTLTSISLPASVTSIGDYAFYYCTALTSISLPNNVTSIGQYAFYRCSNLASVYLPSSLTSIDGYAFYNCTALTSISLPASVTTIGNNAFSSCANLSSATFESNSQLTSIGNSAFNGCSALTSISLPESLTSIGSNAFYSCSNLAIIYLPSRLTSIDGYAFYNCNKLYTIINGSKLTLSLGSTYYGYVAYYAKNIITAENGYQSIEENDISYYKDSTRVIAYACNNSSITTVSLRNDCTEIANYAFSGCSALTSITIPSSVTSIGSNAFYGCYKLVQIRNLSGQTLSGLPSNVGQEILTNTTDAFSNSLTIGDKYITYQVGTVKYLMGVADYSITEINDLDGLGITDIYSYAFYNNIQLASISLPASVTSIGDYAFYYCTALTSISLPASVTTIGNYSFYSCTNLASVTFESNSQLTSIEQYAFRGCSSLTSIVLPDGVTSIGDYAFYYCSNLASVVLPSSLTSIGSYAFSDCSALTSITIPSGVTSIGSFAFRNCTRLASVTFEHNSRLTSIGQYAFSGCSALTSITIPSGVTSIGSNAFDGCYKLVQIRNLSGRTLSNVPSNVGQEIITNASDEFANTLIIGDKYITYQVGSKKYLMGVADYSITEINDLDSLGITSIYSYAFYNNKQLTSISLPASVTSIGQYAFNYCSNLASVVLPSSLTSIGNNAFYYCTALTSITIPSGVISIGKSAFYGCSRLTSVNFIIKTGWKRGSSGISSSDLSNTSTAATYLRSTYVSSTWTRS